MAPTDEAEKALLKKATEHLDKCASALKMCQKHIRKADYG